jgi:hypothetical protein
LAAGHGGIVPRCRKRIAKTENKERNTLHDLNQTCGEGAAGSFTRFFSRGKSLGRWVPEPTKPQRRPNTDSTPRRGANRQQSAAAPAKSMKPHAKKARNKGGIKPAFSKSRPSSPTADSPLSSIPSHRCGPVPR